MKQCACCGILIPNNDGSSICMNCENGRPGEDLNHEPGKPHSDECECPGCLYSGKWKRLRDAKTCCIDCNAEVPKGFSLCDNCASGGIPREELKYGKPPRLHADDMLSDERLDIIWPERTSGWCDGCGIRSGAGKTSKHNIRFAGQGVYRRVAEGKIMCPVCASIFAEKRKMSLGKWAEMEIKRRWELNLDFAKIPVVVSNAPPNALWPMIEVMDNRGVYMIKPAGDPEDESDFVVYITERPWTRERAQVERGLQTGIKGDI